MKKTVFIPITACILAFLFFACSSPMPSAAPTQPLSTPIMRPTPTSTIKPKPTMRPIPSPTKRPINAPTKKPKPTPVWKTKPRLYVGMKGKEVLSIFGKPDKKMPDVVNYEAWSFYYNAYFIMRKSDSGKAADYVVDEFKDYAWLFEPIGKLQCRMPAKEFFTLIGEPESKGEVIVNEQDEEGVYDWESQLWSYPSKGIEMNVELQQLHIKNSTIFDLHFKPPFSGKTSRGIGIGSTVEEVLAAYGEGIYPQENLDENSITVGVEYCLRFVLSNGKVSEIYVGHFRE